MRRQEGEGRQAVELSVGGLGQIQVEKASILQLDEMHGELCAVPIVIDLHELICFFAIFAEIPGLFVVICGPDSNEGRIKDDIFVRIKWVPGRDTSKHEDGAEETEGDFF